MTNKAKGNDQSQKKENDHKNQHQPPSLNDFRGAEEYRKALINYRWGTDQVLKESVIPESTVESHEEHHDHHIEEDPIKALQHVNHSEGYADQMIIKRLSYLFENAQTESLLKKAARYLTAPAAVTPEAFDVAYYESLTEKQKIVRVLLALEKLSVFNHHCFTESERRLLTPSKQGMGSKAYNIASSMGLAAYFFYAVMHRRNTATHLFTLCALGTLNYAYFQKIPLQIKEHYRVRRALRLAGDYYNKYRKNMDIFAQILHPYTNQHILEHLQL